MRFINDAVELCDKHLLEAVPENDPYYEYDQGRVRNDVELAECTNEYLFNDEDDELYEDDFFPIL